MLAASSDRRALVEPVLVHVNNDPQLGPDTESCYLMGQCLCPTSISYDATRDGDMMQRIVGSSGTERASELGIERDRSVICLRA